MEQILVHHPARVPTHWSSSIRCTRRALCTLKEQFPMEPDR